MCSLRKDLRLRDCREGSGKSSRLNHSAASRSQKVVGAVLLPAGVQGACIRGVMPPLYPGLPPSPVTGLPPIVYMSVFNVCDKVQG